jgi:hypothetical protein
MKWVDEHNGKRKVDVVDVLSVGGAVEGRRRIWSIKHR